MISLILLCLFNFFDSAVVWDNFAETSNHQQFIQQWQRELYTLAFSLICLVGSAVGITPGWLSWGATLLATGLIIQKQLETVQIRQRLDTQQDERS